MILIFLLGGCNPLANQCDTFYVQNSLSLNAYKNYIYIYILRASIVVSFQSCSI